LIKGEYIAKYTKSQSLKQWGYLSRTKEKKVVKKITDWNPEGVRTKGWPKRYLERRSDNELKKMKLRNWSQHVTDSRAWNELVQGTRKPCRGFVSEEGKSRGNRRRN
jgi:hypothetical protein